MINQRWCIAGSGVESTDNGENEDKKFKVGSGKEGENQGWKQKMKEFNGEVQGKKIEGGNRFATRR